jgi:hypothetical protein
MTAGIPSRINLRHDLSSDLQTNKGRMYSDSQPLPPVQPAQSRHERDPGRNKAAERSCNGDTSGEDSHSGLSERG